VLEDVDAAAIHPDGKTLAFVRDDKLWLAALRGGPAREFWPGPLGAPFASTTMRFSPDGSHLAFNNATVVWLFPYPTGKPRKLYAVPAAGELVDDASWLPGSRSLLLTQYLGTRSALIRLEIKDGSRQAIYSAGSLLMNPSISPDGTRIAYSAGDYQWDVVEIALADGAVHALVGNGGINTWPDWAPSGTHFLFTAGDAIVDQEASGAGFSRRLIETAQPTRPRWSPDGTRFVFVEKGAPYKLMLANASGGHAIVLDQAADIAGVSWSPDGQWISYVRGNEVQSKLAKIRPTPGASPVILGEIRPRFYNATQWSPTGDWILYSTSDGLDLISPDGKLNRKLTSRQFSTYNFSKDGSQVYGILHNTTAAVPEWQLYEVNVQTGAEKLISAVDFPPSTARLAAFSIHPDGKRALTSIPRFPFQLWMLEGFDQPRKSWFARLMRR